MNRSQLLRRLAPVVAAALVSACAASQPSTSPPTSAPASASGAAGLDYEAQPGDGEALAPGTYVMTSMAPLRISFTVPSGWFKGTIDWAVWDNDTNASVAFVVPENLYADPCSAAKGMREPAVGPSVADLVDALRTVPGASAGPTTDVTVGGFVGKRLDLATDEPAACQEAVLWEIGGTGMPLAAPGAPLSLRVIDAGGTRLVVTSRTPADASSRDLAELEDVIASVRIERP